MNYEDDREWSDKSISIIKQKVGPLLLNVSSFKQDAIENTDLIVLCADKLKIACRVRRFGYALDYPNQITIRNHRTSGSKTELDKIKDGFGDWMFYGHATKDDLDIKPWWIIDLNTIRYYSHKPEFKGKIKFDFKNNPDGTTGFIWFDITSFPPEPKLIIAQG